MNRYFILFYSGSAIGNTPFVNTEGEYPSLTVAQETCKRSASESNICITNIIELPEEDFKSWVGPESWQEWLDSKKITCNFEIK